MLHLDAAATLAFGGLVLFLGHGLKKVIRPLARVNIPAPVVGGLLVAAAITAARAAGHVPIAFDTAWRTPLMIAFFTSLGFGASLRVLRTGGPAVLLFLLAATVAAVGQNLVGGGLAWALGESPLLGVLAGSVTLAGGPATGLAFAPLFEEAGVPGAATLAVAAAMGGIVSGGLLGGPLGTYLIERRKLRPAPATAPATAPAPVATSPVEEPPPATPSGEDGATHALLKSFVALLVAMALGAWLSGWFKARGLTLPAYIGAMLVAAVIRNVDDATGWPALSQRVISDLGDVALALFLALALMTLELWQIANLAVPLAVILAGQIVFVAALCLGPIPRIMGRDYDAAVTSSGFCGFMLGTTANAMANMMALVGRYGPAPRAFLVVPIVGAFFIDFTNALLITFFVNVWR